MAKKLKRSEIPQAIKNHFDYFSPGPPGYYPQVYRAKKLPKVQAKYSPDRDRRWFLNPETDQWEEDMKYYHEKNPDWGLGGW